MGKKRVTAVIIALGLLLAAAVPAANAATATNVKTLGEPTGLYAAEDGTLLITDVLNNSIVTLTQGEVKTLAGYTDGPDAYGRPADGLGDGDAAGARFAEPWAITPYLNGYAVTDTANNVVRYIAGGKVYTLAGSGENGCLNGSARSASFSAPMGIAADENGNLYVADCFNSVIRKIATNGTVTTWAGSVEGYGDGNAHMASFSEPTGVCWYNGTLFVCDSGNNCIRTVKDDVVTTLCGIAQSGEDSKTGGYVDGPTKIAQFSNPTGILATENAVYISDTGNAAVRVLKDGYVSTLCSGYDDGGQLFPAKPCGLALSGETLYVADSFAGLVFGVNIADETVTYKDVDASDDWAGAVDFATRYGLFGGDGAGRFMPNAAMTRGVFVTVLMRLYGITYPDAILTGKTAFDDVEDGQWYTDGVAWSTGAGIAQGVGMNLFGTDQKVTRQQAALFMFRYAQLCGCSTQVSPNGDWYTALDRESCADWASEAVIWAVTTGVLDVGSDGRIAPDEHLSRAQAAEAFMAFCENVLAA